MNRVFPASILLLSAWLSHAYAKGEAAPTVDPDVTCVVKAGSWSAQQTHGQVRVVVRDSGLDHVRSEVWLEWVEESGVGGKIHSRVPITEINHHVGLTVGCPEV